MVVSDYILFIVFIKFPNLDPLLCHFCPFLTSPNKIGQKVEQLKPSEQNLVSDHHGHPVFSISHLSVSFGAECS